MRAAVRVSLVGCVAAAACASDSKPASAPADRSDSVRPVLRAVHEVPGPAWSLYETPGHGRTVQVFVSHDREPKPVVFLLQGSGCVPAFTAEADGRFDPTNLFQDVLPRESSRVHFAIVEKPGVATLRFTTGMTHQQKVQAFERAGRECAPAFFDNATKPVRVTDVLDAIAAVSAQPWARGIILAGHSEGTHVATGVVRHAAKGTVAAAGLFASAGPVQFWSGSVSSAGANRESFQSAFDRMRMLQSAPDDFMYQGLPARRYKTFWLESTPIEDVRDSDVPLFVAQGSRDGTLMPSDLFAMEAIRQQPNRPLRYVVVEGGDHAFSLPDGASRLTVLFGDFLDWALDSKRATGTAVLK
jgi:hypothetical protein